ncbi:MAG TPA: glutamate--tRNA ligase [bacterium]
MSVRVRFAPSPTGTLHVGSARTALFNWLFAKRQGGVFILRIEDTDRKRSDPAFLQDIYESLAFLGIKADEGPVFQSERQALYREQADRLLKAGAAVEEEGAVVFPVPFQQVAFEDLLHGRITVDTGLIDRIVLLKSDGSPAYNFACVVDDALMRISHVIRGDDHIANTPKQLVLYRALGFDLPVFAHIPLIVGADRARLSKRQGATSVSEYRKVGYLPEAFVNYLALLGWSPGGNRELVPPEELVQLFDLSRVKKTAAQFDQRKLDWLNSQYLKRLGPARLAPLLSERAAGRGWRAPSDDPAWFERLARVIGDRIKVLEDIEEEHAFFFADSPVYDEAAVEKYLRDGELAPRLLALNERLAGVEPFEAPGLEAAARALIEELGIEAKALIHPVRVALTGRSVSPPLFDVIALLGRDRVRRRLDYAATHLVPQPR